MAREQASALLDVIFLAVFLIAGLYLLSSIIEFIDVSSSPDAYAVSLAINRHSDDWKYQSLRHFQQAQIIFCTLLLLFVLLQLMALKERTGNFRTVVIIVDIVALALIVMIEGGSWGSLV
jgi:hypothetical protein